MDFMDVLLALELIKRHYMILVNVLYVLMVLFKVDGNLM